MKTRHYEKGSAVTITLVILLIVGIAAALGYVAYGKFMAPKADEVTPSVTQDVTTLKTFKTEKKGISFQYPADWTVSETVNDGSTDDYYQTLVTVKNSSGKTLAQLGTNGQVGGTCPADSPYQAIETTIKNSVELGKFKAAAFGYTIVQRTDDTYGATFGLVKNSSDMPISVGSASVQCPSMSVNYQYMIQSVDSSALGSVQFGLWYTELLNGSASGGIGDLSFATLDEAKAYAETTEFQQVQAMIESIAVE